MRHNALSLQNVIETAQRLIYDGGCHACAKSDAVRSPMLVMHML